MPWPFRKTGRFAVALAVAAALTLTYLSSFGEKGGVLDALDAHGPASEAVSSNDLFFPVITKSWAFATPSPTPATMPSCGAARELSTFSPLALADFTSITPLGNLNPSGHTFPTDHVYFILRQSDPAFAPGIPAEVPLHSPAGGWISSLSRSENLTAGYADYSIAVSPCREFEIQLGHVTTLSQRLSDRLVAPFDTCNEYATGGQSYRYCYKSFRETEIGVAAGERLGTAGGRAGQNALDVWARDSRASPLVYANPSRWSGPALQVVCPLDYFVGGVKNALYGKVPRTLPPICGEVEQDEPSTAQGVWFVLGTTQTYPEDPHLALVHDNFDPSQGAFSVGTSMSRSGLSSGVYRFTPANVGRVNRDFSDVTDGNIYCYEPQYMTTIILQLTGPNTLRIERQTEASCGNGPWVFGTSHTDFER
ncbi:MAG: hypothetical protein HY675_28985 [Chloroflexi bacterium]|nr:hypothetical protein [Chloroflexota bacterium]